MLLGTTLPLTTEAQSSDPICFAGICFQPNSVNTDPNQNPFGDGNTVSTVTSGNRSDLSTFQNIIISFSYFLNNVLLPFLFALALLIFLVNVARYFIIGGGNQKNREKARLLAIYSIAAFVFLVSIWGIVNMFVSSLGFNNTTAMCPDYLGSWCNSRGSSGSSGNNSYFPSNSGSYGTGNSGSGYINNTDSESGTNNPDPIDAPSGIAELVFGNSADISNLNFTTGQPRAQTNTPIIAENQSCDAALQTLMLASEVEENQAAFLLYQDSEDNYHWQNLTDLHFPGGVNYDADTISSLVANGAHNLYLLHTHQLRHSEDVGFMSDGSYPSAADMRLMCDSVTRNMTHVLVDQSNLWVMTQQTNTCPRSQTEESLFPTIEAIGLLSQTPAGIRNQEFFDLINSPLVLNQYNRAFNGYRNQNFNSMTSAEVRGVVAPLLSQARMTIEQSDINSFCSGL